ncbi:hypothetical protein C2W62_31935 [Candidatus Entotheonella serta]|nr:hypothetical protein C2W62_31935 [Candidatus Entotheonella serta]
MFYCDSGAYFIKSVIPLIELCQEKEQDIIPFEIRLQEKFWTKRDAFILMDCDRPEYTDSFQRIGIYSLWRKTDFSTRVVDEWLTYAQDARIITDMPNQCGQPYYPGYRDHRHDQSIFSLLSKQYQLEAYRDPANPNPAQSVYYPNSPYEPLIRSTRKRNSWAEFLHLPKLIVALPVLWRMWWEMRTRPGSTLNC